MPRSHPPTLIRLVERALRDEVRAQRGDRALLAVSGGADSMALLSVLARVGPKHGLHVAAHGIDHGLRAEAAAELDLAERYATEAGVPFSRTRLLLSPGANLQARARAARYEALREAARHFGASWIATAHHADDRAETLLIRLLRGTSPRGLAVLPARSGILARPLIRARKRDVLSHVERHGVPFANDPSNRDPRFLRVRVRHELMPLLEGLSPRIVEHLNSLADELMDAPTADEGHALPVDDLLGTAQRRALRDMLHRRSRSARVLLRGGRELALDAASGEVVVRSPPPSEDD